MPTDAAVCSGRRNDDGPQPLGAVFPITKEPASQLFARTSTLSILAEPPHAAPATLCWKRSPIRRRVTLAITDLRLFLAMEVSSQIVPSGLVNASMRRPFALAATIAPA